MKRFFALMSLVLGAIAFTGCNSSNIEESPVKEGNFCFTVNMDAMTRATVEKNNVVFKAGDKVAFGAAEHATTDTVTKAMIAEYNTSDGMFYCDTVLDGTKSFDFYALWPYQAGSKGASFNLPSKLKNPNQYSTYVYVGKNSFGQVAQNIDSAMQYAPMIGVNTVGSPAAGASVNLHHLASMLEFSVKNATSASVKFSSLKMTVGDGTKFCGTYYVDMTTGALSPSGADYVYNNCTVNIEGNSDDVAVGSSWKFYMPIAPVTLAAGTEITFDITASDGTVCRVVKHIPSSGSVTFEAGKWNTQNLDYTGASTITYDTIADVLGGENGSYDVHGALIYAKGDKNFIIGDNTGFMLMYSSNTLNVGDVINVNGNVVVYNGVKEFSNPTITSTGTATVYYPTPVEFNYSSYTSSPFVGYIDASGVLSAKNLTKDSENYYIYVNTGVDTTGLTGKDVVCQGFAFGYHQKNKTVSYIITSISEDSSIPSLTLDHETIHFDADDWGASGSFKTVHATVLNTEITDLTSSDATWCLAERAGNTIYISAHEQNTTGSTRTATVTVNTAAGISKTITVTQASATGATIASILAAGAGTYTLTGATVYAYQTSLGSVIIGDGTGFMLVHQPTVEGGSLALDNTVTVSGDVELYTSTSTGNQVYQWNAPTITITATGNPEDIEDKYPTPVTLSTQEFNAYMTQPAQIIFAKVTGLRGSSDITDANGNKYVNSNSVGASFSGMSGSTVYCKGFLFGYNTNNSTINILATWAEKVESGPSFTISPSTLNFQANESGSDAAKQVACTVNNTTLSSVACDQTWLHAEISSTTSAVIVYPTSANSSTDNRTATVTISTAAGISKNVTVTQYGASSSTAAYTLQTVNGGTTNNAYASTYDVTINEITWNAPGNQNFDGYWRIGGKSLTNVDRVIYGKGAIAENVNSIVVSTNGISRASVTVNSITITVHSSATDAASGSNVFATFTTSDALDFATGTAKNITFSKSGSANCAGKYYRIVFNITNTTSSNGGLDLTKIVFNK